MLLFYIRHGDPVYDPDSLTPLGHRQAEALAKRLAMHGVDKIFSSTSERAKLTAKPSCEIMKKEMTLLDFTNEKYAAEEFGITLNGKWNWVQGHPEMLEIFVSPEVRQLGFKWYEHPKLKQYNFKKGIDRVYDEADKFLLSLGYEHIRYTGKYRIVKPNGERVALFAHAGFGLAFMSAILDIPYPEFTAHFDMCHSGMTVIKFGENGEYAVPQIKTYSSDSHLYREGLPTNYNNAFRF